MSVGYNKNKVEDFNNKLNKFLNNKNKYISSLETLNTTISTVINNYRTAPTDNQNTFYKDSNNNYILTPEKVLMRISQDIGGTDISDIPDSSFNTLINIDGSYCFYSNIEYKNTNSSNNNDKISNRYVQVGFGNDLTYNTGSHITNTNNIYKVDKGSKPEFENGTDCDDNFLYKCDGYSKMTGSNFYGIGYNGDTNANNCECYVMKKTPFESIDEKVFNIDVTEALLGNNDFKTNYLGIMMNGNAYALNDNNFSENFNNVYEPNPNKHIAIFDRIEKTDCNMYTGSGVYGININSLGETSCAKK